MPPVHQTTAVTAAAGHRTRHTLCSRQNKKAAAAKASALALHNMTRAHAKLQTPAHHAAGCLLICGHHPSRGQDPKPTAPHLPANQPNQTAGLSQEHTSSAEEMTPAYTHVLLHTACGWQLPQGVVQATTWHKSCVCNTHTHHPRHCPGAGARLFQIQKVQNNQKLAGSKLPRPGLPNIQARRRSFDQGGADSTRLVYQHHHRHQHTQHEASDCPSSRQGLRQSGLQRHPAQMMA
jgi:hypothetical protein